MLSEKDMVRLLFRQWFVPRLCAFLSCVFRIHAGLSGVPDAGGLQGPARLRSDSAAFASWTRVPRIFDIL